MKKRQVYDPNSHLDSATIERGLTEACKALAAVGPTWRRATHPSCHSLLWLRQTRDWHVLYVRVTTDEAAFVGVGERPGVLHELARELHADMQVVVRVHLGADGAVKLIGFQNVIAKLRVKAHEWERGMLDGRTARERPDLTGGAPAVLNVNLPCNPDRPRRKPGSAEKLIKLFKAEHADSRLMEVMGTAGETEEAYVRRRLAEFAELRKAPAHGHFRLQLAADGLAETKSSVNFAALARSTPRKEHHDILTCSCGSSPCAGTEGMRVTHESGLTVWWLWIEETGRFLVFDQQQYRNEILSRIRGALRFHATLPHTVRFGGIGYENEREEQRSWIEGALAKAETFTR